MTIATFEQLGSLDKIGEIIEYANIEQKKRGTDNTTFKKLDILDKIGEDYN